MGETGEIHIKECAQELCISFLKNVVQLADTYTYIYIYTHSSILMFTNRGKIFKIDDNYVCA